MIIDRFSKPALLTALLACLCAPMLSAADAPAPAKPKAPTAADILAAAQASEWRALDPENTLYLELESGRVVIELAPAFAPKHTENIKALARENYFDGLAILRSQDNYVVQWGDPNGGEAGKEKPIKNAQRTLKAEFEREWSKDLPFTRLADGDVYAPEVGHSNGFPLARDPKTNKAWLTHCYGMVGVGRDNDADSGGGTELYVVNGHAPRHLDRNVTLVGRVVQGMELLSVLPRGTAAMGFYDKPEQRVAIKSIRVAADLPQAQRSHLEALRTDSKSFAALTEARRNRRSDWDKVPAGRIELCNVQLPVREQKAADAAP